MPLTEDDFRLLLAERAASVGLPDDPVGSVHRRIARRRRRHQSAAIVGAALATVVLAAAVAGPHAGTRGPDHLASPTPSATGLLDEYANGGRLMASTVLLTPQSGETSLVFTPTDWHLNVLTHCGNRWPDGAWSAVQINGHPLMEANGCDGGVSAPYGGEEAFWAALGVGLGRPSRVTVALTATPEERPTGVLALGVYQRVPLDDYPLPARPATIAPLPRVSGPGTLDSRDVSANGTFTVHAVVGPATVIRTTAVAPGALRLLINGTPIDEHDSWGWDTASADTKLDQDTLRRAGLRIPDGTTVTVRVEATRFAVPAWTVEVRAAR